MKISCLHNVGKQEIRTLTDHTLANALIRHRSKHFVDLQKSNRCGESVAHLVPGDRVAIEPGVPCGRCRYCMGGKYNVCPDMRFCAAPPFDGLLREGIVGLFRVKVRLLW